MGTSGLSSFSSLTQLRSTTSACSSAVLARAKTMPGQSISLTFESSEIVCATVVTPGVAPTLTARARLSELMSDDLPTFG